MAIPAMDHVTPPALAKARYVGKTIGDPCGNEHHARTHHLGRIQRHGEAFTMELDIHYAAANHCAAVLDDLTLPIPCELRRTDALLPKQAVHGIRRCVSTFPRVNDEHVAPRTRQHQRTTEPRRSASGDDDVDASHRLLRSEINCRTCSRLSPRR